MYDESDAEFDRLQAEAERIDAIVDEEYYSRMKDLDAIEEVINRNADILATDLYSEPTAAFFVDAATTAIEDYSDLLARFVLKHEMVLETIKRCVRNECEQDLNL